MESHITDCGDISDTAGAAFFSTNRFAVAIWLPDLDLLLWQVGHVMTSQCSGMRLTLQSTGRLYAAALQVVRLAHTGYS